MEGQDKRGRRRDGRVKQELAGGRGEKVERIKRRKERAGYEGEGKRNEGNMTGKEWGRISQGRVKAKENGMRNGERETEGGRCREERGDVKGDGRSRRGEE